MRALIWFTLFVILFFLLLNLDHSTLVLGRGNFLLAGGGILRVDVAESSCARISRRVRGRSAAGRTYEASWAVASDED
jgi:hypothetical protein